MDRNTEHCVIVNFDYKPEELDPLFELENELRTAISDAAAGKYDGHEVEIDGTDCILYMYGPDADKLLAAILPILRHSRLIRGAQITLQYGPPDIGTRKKIYTLGKFKKRNDISKTLTRFSKN